MKNFALAWGIPTALVHPAALWHFVLYDRPADFPGYAVVRGWVIVPGVEMPMPTQWCALYESVEQAQRELAKSPDLVRIPRSPNDEPCIVESWV